MRVDGGDNCHDFGYKHLLYDFLLEKSVKVADISTFWDACIGLVPIIIPGKKTIRSLDLEYSTPTDEINTLSLSNLKIYNGFLDSSHEAL